MIKKNTGLWLAFYSLLAFALSAWLLQFNYFMTPDGVHYARMGENLTRGKGVGINPGEPYVERNPLYPFLIGITDLFVQDLELSGHLVSMAAFALTIIPLFLLVSQIYSRAAAYWTIILYLTFEFFLYYSNQVLTEPLFTFLIIAFLFCVHQFSQRSRRTALQGTLLGLVGGLAFLTRSEALLFFLVGVTALLFGKGIPFSLRFRRFLIACTVFLLFSVPYLAYIHRTIGKVAVSGHAPNILIHRELDLTHPGRWGEAKKIYEGLSRDKTRMKIDELLEEFDSLDFFRKNYSTFFRSGLASTKWRFLELTEILFQGAAFFLIGASFFSVPWARERKKSELLLVSFLLPLFPYFFLFFDPRHYHPFLVIFLIWMGNGVERIRTWAQETFGWSPRKTLLLGFAVSLFFVGVSASRVHRTLRNISLPLAHKAMAFWMKENIPNISEEKVASRLAYVNFYSGAKILRLPYVEKFEDLRTYLNLNRAKYFVVTEDLGAPQILSYRFLLDETKPLPPGMTRVHTVYGKKKAMLFEIR